MVRNNLEPRTNLFLCTVLQWVAVFSGLDFRSIQRIYLQLQRKFTEVLRRYEYQ